MGGAKRLMEEHEALVQHGASICLKVGALKSCPVHGDCFDGNGDLEAAYRYANAMITQGNITLSEGVSRRNFSDAIKEAYEGHAGIDYCPSCDHYMRE